MHAWRAIGNGWGIDGNQRQPTFIPRLTCCKLTEELPETHKLGADRLRETEQQKSQAMVWSFTLSGYIRKNNIVFFNVGVWYSGITFLSHSCD